MNTIEKVFDMPQGGTVKVTVRSLEPIDENNWMILKPQAATELANCLTSIGNALSPIEKGK